MKGQEGKEKANQFCDRLQETWQECFIYPMDQIFEKLKKKFFIRHLPFPMRYSPWCGVRVETCKTFAVSQHDLFFCNTQEDPQLLD
jgi:hypothetical protein